MKSEQSTVSTKGQLVIPARLRKKYSIRKGTKVAFIEDGHRLILQPVTDAFIQRIRGSLKGGPSLLAILRKERKRDRYL
jgi:AbrB family looped-hinge helix DNA binding protein